MSVESVIPSNHLILCPHFSSCLQSFPASGAFPMGWLYASGGQSIGVSVLASVLPMNIQDWFLLGLTGLISLQSKGLSRVFSRTTVQKHIVCIICIVLSNPLLRSGAPQAPPVLFQHPAESKAISACQPFTPPHCLSPTGDSVAQTLLTYLKNSKLLQLKKKKNMHKYGPDAQIKFKGNRLWTQSCQQGPHNHIPSSSHVVSTCRASSGWVCSGFPLSKLALCLWGFSSALFLAVWLTMKQKAFFFFNHSVQVSSVQSLSRVRLFATPWITARQASLSITNSWSSLKLTSIESVMSASHLILCRPLLLLPPIPPSIRVFSNESTLRMR